MIEETERSYPDPQQNRSPAHLEKDQNMILTTKIDDRGDKVLSFLKCKKKKSTNKLKIFKMYKFEDKSRNRRIG